MKKSPVCEELGSGELRLYAPVVPFYKSTDQVVVTDGGIMGLRAPNQRLNVLDWALRGDF